MEAGDSKGGIKHRFAKSGMWMIIQATFNNLSAMVVFIALARLLTPQQFGLVAFATIFIDFGRILVMAGIPDALIQRLDWDEDVASTAFWTNLGLSATVCLFLSLCAAPFASTFYDPTFSLVLAALSVSLLIDGMTAVHGAKLRREFRYDVLAARGMIANVLSGVLGVTLAYMGYGVWALVISRLFAALVTTFLVWISTGWRPRLTFSLDHVRSFRTFSLHLLGVQLLAASNTQIVGVIIGAFLGPAALAQFRVGSRALNMLVSMVITPLQSAATSAFSRMQDRDGRIGAAYLRLTRTCSLIACPVFLGSAVIAPDFVRVVFGKQWEAAGYIMAINGMIVLPAVIMYFFTPALASIGKSSLALQSSIAACIGNLLAAAATVPFGVIAVAAGQTIRSHITLPFSLVLLRRGLNVAPFAMLRSVMPALVAAGVMALILEGLSLTMLVHLEPIARMALVAVFGVPLYVVILLIIDRHILLESAKELAPLLQRFRRTPSSPF